MPITNLMRNSVAPLNLTDSYKLHHEKMYKEGSEYIFCNITPRSNKYLTLPEGVKDNKYVAFGIEAFLEELNFTWGSAFFNLDHIQIDAKIERFKKTYASFISADSKLPNRFRRLWEKHEELPIEFRYAPSGTLLDIKSPYLTLVNTDPEFFWLPNFLETHISVETWKRITIATIARGYRSILEDYAKKTGSPRDFIQFQAHDFSMRGMSCLMDTYSNCSAHLMYFTGTDTLTSVEYMKYMYPPKDPNTLIGASVPACYSKDTEILTDKGWKLFSELDKTELVAQYNDDKTIEFVKPTEYFKDYYEGDLVHFKSKENAYNYLDIMVTPNHKMVYENNGAIKLFEASDFYDKNGRKKYHHRNKIVISGKSNVVNSSLSELDRLKIAFQADGSFMNRSESYNGQRTGCFPIRFHLKKERKKERLVSILDKLGVEYTLNKDKKEYYSFYIKLPEKLSKTFEWVDIKNISTQWGKEFVEELVFWDGRRRKGGNAISYSSIEKINIDIVQAISAVSGAKSQYSYRNDKRTDFNRKTLHTLILINDKQTIFGNKSEAANVPYKDYVYCVSVPSKKIVVRRNNKVLVCGNTEHSVSMSNILSYSDEELTLSKDQNNIRNEIAFMKELIGKYPTGILSYVADTYDYWGVLSKVLPALKKEITSRKPDMFGNSKLVIRPDSGEPIDIICGTKWNVADKTGLTPEEKGSLVLLKETFGGELNKAGYFELSKYIGLIYGDSITPQRMVDILDRMKTMGFASSNIVFGVGSYTYNFNTRDTLGTAMKATHSIIDGKEYQLYKDPKTDSGTKKSAKGMIIVTKEGMIDCLDKKEYTDLLDKSILKLYTGLEVTHLEDIRELALSEFDL